ncbi:MAG: methylmalonyl-CoA mutase subunit beta [Bacteroidales bacterium]|nr:methylmalonyl-CoA mutase subunit beta [Bacteroidales bacterium]
MKKKRLFEEFPPVTSVSWKSKIIDDLKGADFDKKLVWRSDEGFEINPYYMHEDLEPLQVRQSGENNSIFTGKEDNDWKIRQDFKTDGAVDQVNSKMRQAIDRGADALGIDLMDQSTSDKKFFEQLFDGINIEKTEINFYNAGQPQNFFNAFVSFLKDKKTDAEKIHGSLGLEPLGDMVSKGVLDTPALEDLADIILATSDTYRNLKIIQINGGIFQDGGGTLSQELGFSLAMANEYISRLSKLNIPPALAVDSIFFSYSTGPDYFMEIAKLRAARWLWSAICREWGIEKDQFSMHIHSRSASWNLTLYDPNVNMLRTTTETMAASIGGSDSITVLPFDVLTDSKSELSSRIARNIQVILKEESHFNKVLDPGAGSYYIENIAESMAKKAWEYFTETEEKGGFIEAFKKGWIQEQVAGSLEKKRIDAASGKRAILGVNQYPVFSEMLLSQGITPPEETSASKTSLQPIKPFRIAGEIESLRLQTEKHGVRPKVFLLKLGDPGWSAARATFAGNFFACAGYGITDHTTHKNPAKRISEARLSGAEIVVLCSSDDEYIHYVPAVRKSLSGSAEIAIAGYPKDHVGELQKMGIEHFIHVRSNLVDELKKFHSILGILD